MTEKRYNGWTNYETWNVALWIGNEEGSSRYWDRMAQECWDDAEADRTFTREELASAQLATQLKDEITESAPDLGASMFSDLLGAALSEVNWDEIAESYISEVDRTEAEEEAEVEIEDAP